MNRKRTQKKASSEVGSDAQLQKTLSKNHPLADDLDIIKSPENCDKVSPKQTVVDHVQDHRIRRTQMTEKYPQLKELMRPDSSSFFWGVAIVSVQLASLYLVRDLGPIALFLYIYCIGAVADHALWVLIHDATHDLAFKKPNYNKVFQLFLNLPLVFPSALSFRMYHRQHHSHMGETYADPDLPGPLEQMLGRNILTKLVWLLFFPLIMSARVVRYQQEFDWWITLNWLIQVPFNALVYYYTGMQGIVYLFFSSIFAVGLHPLGARWLAEHFATHPDQETYSYYGSANLLSFNVGYHYEHHDMPTIPWSRLPQVKKIAPEFYEPLHTVNSYLGLMWRFLTDSNFTLASRIVRPSKGSRFENLRTFL